MSRSLDAAEAVLSRPIERALGEVLVPNEHQLGKCWRCFRDNGQPNNDFACSNCRAFLDGSTDVDPRTGVRYFHAS